MGSYTVRLLRSARKQLEALQSSDRRRVARAIDALQDDPGPRGSRLLSGGPRQRIYRVRVGVLRILYQVEDEQLVVLVVAIGHRGDVYR